MARVFFKSLKHGFRLFGLCVNNVVVGVALFIVYIIGIGITSLIAKIVKRRFLDLGNSKKKSYWIIKTNEKDDMENYRRSF